MPIDIGVLVSTVVARFLVPYAKMGVERIGAELKERVDAAVGDQAAGLVEKVWKKTTGLFQGPQEEFLVKSLEESPEDAAPLFRKELQKKLEADPEAARELDEMVHTSLPGAGGVSVSDVMGHVGVFVAHGGTFSGGQQAGMIINQGSSGPPAGNGADEGAGSGAPPSPQDSE